MDWKKRVISASKGSLCGAIVACALGETIPAPCFHGKAVVTSDGFVMCDFTDARGNRHMGALVGSVDDLVRNVGALAAHAKLDKAEKADFLQRIREWIATDYQGRTALRLGALAFSPG